MHAAVSIHGHMLMLVDEMKEHGVLSPLSLGGSPVILHLNVPDADAAIDRAADAGATIVWPPMTPSGATATASFVIRSAMSGRSLIRFARR